jgi:peroxiredoxin/mono/diheme cytochrome c family protein
MNAPRLLLAGLCSVSLALAQDAPHPKPGAPIKELVFKDTRYSPRTLSEFGSKRAFALLFVTDSCPIAKRYLPEIKRLHGVYAKRGVQFLVVSADPDRDIGRMAAFALTHDLPMPIVKDTGGRAARALGVTRTPEVALLDGKLVLRYRGRVDDQIKLGGLRPKASRRDLVEALDELLAQKPVSVARTPVDGCRLSTAPADPVEEPPTFARDIAPLTRRHCVECHRPKGSAPFSLVGYDDVARVGTMVAEVVAERRMPPWFAEGGAEEFSNHRGLSPDERRLIVDWVASGMRKGDATKIPPPPALPKGKWSIGEPDLMIRMKRPIKVRADGYMPYQYVMLQHRFDHDTWIQKLEIVGDNPEVLHHCNVFFLRPGKAFESSQIVAGKVPGGSPLNLKPGVAALIPKGAMLGLQIHYQPNGTAVEDRVSIGLAFPKAPVQKRFRAAIIENRAFAIPPGAPHHRVAASYTFAETVISGGLFGHMHVRGKDVTFRATYPDGRAETLLRVPNYSFDWQTAYAFRTPKRFPKGTRIDCVAHFDNSKFNPFNPDPSKTVRYGLQTTEEMMYCFAFYVNETEALGIRVDPKTGAALR